MTALTLGMTTDACCPPADATALDVGSAERLARVFRALGEPTRLRLLSLIAAQIGGEACLCDLTGPVGLSQPTVSHHMKQLTVAGLVTREQRGRWAFYRLTDLAHSVPFLDLATNSQSRLVKSMTCGTYS